MVLQGRVYSYLSTSEPDIEKRKISDNIHIGNLMKAKYTACAKTAS